MTGRRKARALSAAERHLWHDWARRTAVVPLPGKALDPAAAPSPPITVPESPLVQSVPAPRRAGPPAELHVGVAPSGLDDRRWRDLRRGRMRPERTLDLHGYRAQEAHHAVRGFLRKSAAEGLRCIAIVTGRGSSPEGGILRRELPHWLNAPDIRPMLLGAAHPHASNAGAVHLLLRRRR
jgi:DNA-nicking Smr family endonuclease